MSLSGNPSSLANFSAKLRELPRVVAMKVATAAAPVITEAARATFEAGENAYGTTWAPSVDGDKVTLTKSGALSKGIRYVAAGTKIRVALPTSYAKYQIGRRRIFPNQGAPLPTSYVVALKDIVAKVLAAEVAAA